MSFPGDRTMGTHSSKGSRSRAERLTVLDIAGFIGGVAVVLSLPWSNRPERLSTFGSGWYSYPLRMYIAAEALGKVALVLVPVILVRSARRDGLARPAECLLACMGLPWLAQGIHDLLLLAWLRSDGSAADMLSIPYAKSEEWDLSTRKHFHQAWFSLLIVASMTIAAGRRRMPGWCIAALIMAAWLGAHECLVFRRWRPIVVMVVGPFRPSNAYLAEAILLASLFLPFLLLFSIPASSALMGDDRNVSTGRSPLEWAGMVIFALSSLAYGVARLLITGTGSLWPMFVTETLILAALIVLSGSLGCLLLRRITPAWKRWLGQDYDGISPGSPTLEA